MAFDTDLELIIRGCFFCLQVYPIWRQPSFPHGLAHRVSQPKQWGAKVKVGLPLTETVQRAIEMKQSIHASTYNLVTVVNKFCCTLLAMLVMGIVQSSN